MWPVHAAWEALATSGTQRLAQLRATAGALEREVAEAENTQGGSAMAMYHSWVGGWEWWRCRGLVAA